MLWRNHIENMVTLAMCGATVTGLYSLGAGGHSFWAMLMMLNLNYEKSRKKADKAETPPNATSNRDTDSKTP